MENYVVIDGVRYNFTKPNNPIKESCKEQCHFADYCDFEDTPCSIFNIRGFTKEVEVFVKA